MPYGKAGGPDPIDVEIGLAIRRLRKQRAMSQEAVGDAVGVTFQQLQKYERGTNRISASTLVKTAAVLGVQAADLLPQTEAPRLPPSAQLLTSVRGAEELLKGYAAIKSARQRRVVMSLVNALRELSEPESDDTDA